MSINPSYIIYKCLKTENFHKKVNKLINKTPIKFATKSCFCPIVIVEPHPKIHISYPDIN